MKRTRRFRSWLRSAVKPTGLAPLQLMYGRRCPICDAFLGEAPPVTDSGRYELPPSMRLEVGPPAINGEAPWRVSIVPGRFPPARSTDPPFNSAEVANAYLLCGDGHFFPMAATVEAGRDTNIDVFRMLAVIGSPASGKTYLLVRMLHQELTQHVTDGRPTLGRRALTPLEALPLAIRTEMYRRTLTDGRPVLSTNADDRATPAGILEISLPTALEAIRELVRRTTVNGGHRGEMWGQTLRQPLVVRVDLRQRRSWIGLADLPGEMFAGGADSRQRMKIQSYDGIIWTIDPAISPALAASIDRDQNEEQPSAILDGSLRPGSASDRVPAIAASREIMQSDIGRDIGLIDGLFDDDSRTRYVNVAITKCDLIHHALTRRDLAELGPPGAVEEGVTAYLLALAARWSRAVVDADAGVADLLSYVDGSAAASDEVRRARSAQIAASLTRHYSDPERFWNLIHSGASDEIRVDGASDLMLHRWVVRVPSLTEHLDARLGDTPDSIHLRDLVLSAVGCGLAFALGLGGSVQAMLQQPRQLVRFFPCSPLGVVPVATADGRLHPLTPTTPFPEIGERSAAIAQLAMATLALANT